VDGRIQLHEPGIWAPLPSVSLLEADTQVLARSGQIDTTDNLSSARVRLFTGKRDATV